MDKPKSAPVEFTADKLKMSVGYRKWVYVGTPVTPTTSTTARPRFPSSMPSTSTPRASTITEAGEFRDGTVMVKELVGVGVERTELGLPWATSAAWRPSIKDSNFFKDEPGSWAYFSFGHKYPLKAEATKNGRRPRATRATRTHATTD